MKRLTLLLAFFVLAGMTFLQAQTVQVTGTVTSAEDGSGVPGATVIVKGTTNGTLTDVDGKFTIKADANASLVVSYVGLKTQEVAINGQNNLNIVLETDVVGLDEVIIAGVASGTPKRKMSVSVEKVTSDDLLVPASSAASALQGKVAGVTIISSSGNPGQSAGIRLRGSTSITGSQDPLIIIDGVIFSGELSDINADDVESYEVVKGASASALYGSRAGSGVLVITTKRGNSAKEGTTDIRVRNEFGMQSLVKKLDLATHHPYELASDASSVTDYTKYAGVTYPAGYKGEPEATLVGSRSLDFDGYADNNYAKVYDYQDDIFQKGRYYTNYVSIANNSAKTQIFTSFENNRNTGIVWNTDGSSRQNFRTNIDHKISDRLSFSSSTLVTQTSIDMADAREASEYGGDEAYSGGQGTAFFNMLFMEPDVNLDVASPSSYLLNKYYYKPNPWSKEIENPKHSLYYESRDMKRKGLIQNFSGKLRITDWMNAEADYSIDRENSFFTRIRPKGYQIQSLAFVKGQIYKSAYTGMSQTFQGTLNFNKNFDDLNAKAKFSYLYENNKEESFNVTGNDLAAADISSLDIVTGSKSISSYEIQEVAMNYFGILDVDYKERYIASFLYRYDGSSLFGENQRWNPYYRISGAYRLGMDLDVDAIQELKIRGAIGTSGQRPGFSYQYETYYASNGSIGKSTIGNKDLKPSETLEKEIALDVEFLNMFSFEASYSINNTKDAFVNVPLSSATGYSYQWRNAAELESKALELTFGADPIKTKDTKLSFNVSFDRLRQKVVSLDCPAFQVGPGANEVSAFYLRSGEDFGIMYGYDWVTSLDQMKKQLPTGASISDYTVNSDGYVIVKGTEGTVLEAPVALDQNNDGTADFDKIADMNPDFEMSFNTSFAYKHFTVGMLWQWKQGGDIYNLTKQWLYRDNRSGDMDMYGVDPQKRKTVQYFQKYYNANNVNSYFVEDGTYVKLRELSVYYDITGESFSKIGFPLVKGLKIGVIGKNLLTFTKYTGWDPEVSAGGDLTNYAMDIFNYPNFRTISFSAELRF